MADDQNTAPVADTELETLPVAPQEGVIEGESAPAMNRQQKRAQIIHLKKSFGGNLTAEDVHRSLAFPHGTKCSGCGSLKVAIRLTSLAAFDEMQKRDPQGLALIETTIPGGLPSLMVKTRYGPMVRIRTMYACDTCKVAAERAAAKHPSWVIVDIYRGPKNHARVVRPHGD